MLRIGTAEMDITPPPSVPMSGYSARKSGARGVHDPIFARAIVLDNGRARIGWLVADLIGLPAPTVKRVRALASKTARMTPSHILVSTTHCHDGPDTRPQPETDADHAAHKAYLDALPTRMAECIGAAASKLVQTKASFGRAVTDKVQHNRRYHMAGGKVAMDWENPDPAKVAYRGPIDPAVQVLAFEDAKGLRAVLMQFACHATVMDDDNYLVSADWPGAACRHLRRLCGAAARATPWVAMAQGCCADINPRPPRNSFEAVDAKGRLVAEAARRALDRREPVRGDELKSVLIPVKLPLKNRGLDPTPAAGHYRGAVQALRIGDVAVVGLPGEVFVNTGLAIKARSEFRGTLVGSYANDYSLGYVPTSDQYAAGGYEIAIARVAPGADTILAETAIRALSLL